MPEFYNDYFGQFGGRYVAEVLRMPLDELESAFRDAMSDETFWTEFDEISATFTGRPTPLMHANNSSRELGGAQLFVKLEGLANTGAHKINNAVGQILLARQMGKKRIIAETGAGQHGVATAAVCAKFGMECVVYMGEVDIKRQKPNVFWMELFGARVQPVSSGARTLKDAVNEALRDWAGSHQETHYIIGSALGPSPFPDMVREFQSIVGKELQTQVETQIVGKGLSLDSLIACVGGGSNAIGFFAPFLGRERPVLIGVEAGGTGRGRGQHAARMGGLGKPGIVHGYKSLFLLNDDGQVEDTHSVSAGLDYPGIGPQLAALGEAGRVTFSTATDAEALDALRFFARNEGIVFALESAHGAAEAIKRARTLSRDQAVVVNMSGRGDKDLFITARELDPGPWKEFLLAEAAQINSGSSPSVGGVKGGGAA